MPVISSTPTGSEIAAEYGVTLAGSKGSSYYGKNGIPSGAPLKGTDFVGKQNQNPPIWTAGYTVTYYGSPYTAQLYINATGTVVLTNGTNGSWLPSGASAANYQIKWQLLSGNTPTASSGFTTQNSFVPLSSSRTLSVTGTSATTRSCTVRLTLQEIATGAQIVVDVFMEGGGFV